MLLSLQKLVSTRQNASQTKKCPRTCHKNFFLVNKTGTTPRNTKIMIIYGKYWPVAYLSNTVVVEGSGSGGCGLNRSFAHLRGCGSQRCHTHHGYRLH